MKLSVLCLTTLALGLSATSASASEPPILSLRHETDAVSYRMNVTPGVPKPGDTFVVELELGEKLDAVDPRFGGEKPMNGARVDVVLVGPKNTLEVRRAVRLRDAGSFTASFTVNKKGIHGLHVVTRTSDGNERTHGWPIVVGLWPPPEDVEAPALPAKRPE
ncbi:MAG: hypothetical protein AAF658_06060, partial [Myxococcota bacterium]